MPHKPNRPDLKHGWEVRMHHQMPDSDGLLLDEKNPDFVICPGCNARKLRFLVIDVSSLPHALTNGDKWRCDGCWTHWERHGMDCGDGRPFDESIMYEMMGAPPALVDEVRQVVANHRTRYGKPET